MKRRLLIAGNWKMHKRISEAEDLVCELKSRLSPRPPADVILIPPFTALRSVCDLLVGQPVYLGAQNVNAETEGAFTGEISASMLRDVGCDYVLIGHSERRKLFGETDSIINRKIQAAQAAGLQVIFCLGETGEERMQDKTKSVIIRQLERGLKNLMNENMARLIIAYEPVWAIGTGENATPENAQEVHYFIRNWVQLNFGEKIGEQTRILYGGSVKPENSAQLLAQEHIDGLLVGGASLNADSFYAIINSAS